MKVTCFQESMARFMQGMAMPAAQRLMGRRAVPMNVRAYQAAAPTQAPSSQRAIYTNFAIYKGKGAAAFRVCCLLKYFTHARNPAMQVAMSHMLWLCTVRRTALATSGAQAALG